MKSALTPPADALWLAEENRALRDELSEVSEELRLARAAQPITLMSAPTTEHATSSDWNPAVLADYGWERGFHPGLPASDHFEILRSD